MSGAVPYPAGGHRHDFVGGMSAPLEILEDADPLVGIEVNLPRHCQCGHDLLLVGPDRGPHRASLHCARCRRHCGWLSNEAAKFLCDVVQHFGRPTEPVRVRLAKLHVVPNSAPPGADAV